MNPHEPPKRAAQVVFVLVACGLAACGRVPGQFEIVQNQQPTEGCAVNTSSNLYRGDGTLDLQLVRAGDSSAYLAFPLVKNNLPGATGGADTNQIRMNSFAVDIGPSQFGALPPNVATLFDTLNRAPRDSADYALLHYSVPWSANISSGGGLAATLVGAFPVDLARRVAATGDVGISRSSMIVNAHIRAFGSTNTQDYESDPLDFPIYVCAGCLVASVLNCPVSSEPAYTGNPCNVAQDNLVDCCSLNGELICPPIVVSTQ